MSRLLFVRAASLCRTDSVPASSILAGHWLRWLLAVGHLLTLEEALQPGPFLLVLSALWRLPHCWKTSFPFRVAFIIAPSEDSERNTNPKNNQFDAHKYLVYNFPMRPAIILFAKAPEAGNVKTGSKSGWDRTDPGRCIALSSICSINCSLQ